MISGLGKLYEDGEVVVRQGEVGNCMYVIQQGSAEVVREGDGGDVRIATLQKGDSFGEMAIFENEVRSATVRALGEVRILTIDKRTFLRRVQEDPTLAFNILRILSERIRRLDAEIFEYRRRIERQDPRGAPPGGSADRQSPGAGSGPDGKEG